MRKGHVVNAERDAIIFRLHQEGRWTDSQIADLVNVTKPIVGWVVRRMRLQMGMGPRPNGAPPKFTDEGLDGPHCPRCGLRGDHACIPISAAAMAENRRGHWSDTLERPGFLSTGGKG